MARVPTYQEQTPKLSESGSWIIADPTQATQGLNTLVNAGLTQLEQSSKESGAAAGAAAQAETGGAQRVQQSGFLGMRTASSTAFNDAATRTFLAQRESQIKDQAQAILQRHAADPEGARQAWAAELPKLMEGIPAELAGAWRGTVDQVSQNIVRDARTNQHRQQGEQWAITWQESFKRNQDELRRAILQNPNSELVTNLEAEAGRLIAQGGTPTAEGHQLSPTGLARARQELGDTRGTALLRQQYDALPSLNARQAFIQQLNQRSNVPAGVSEPAVRELEGQIRQDYGLRRQEAHENNMLASQRRLESRAGESTSFDNAVGVLQSGGTSNYVFDERRARDTFGPVQAENMRQRYALASAVNETMRGMQNMPIPDMAQHMQTLRDRTQDASLTDEQRVLAQAQLQVAGQRLQAVSSGMNDPDKAWDTLLSQYPAAFRGADFATAAGVDQARARASALTGRPIEQIPALPESQIQALKRQWASSQPEQRAELAAGISQRYGNYAPQILSQMGEPTASIAAGASRMGRDGDAAVAISAQSNLEANRRAVGSQVTRQTIDNNFLQLFPPSRTSMDTRTRDNLQNTYEALVYQYAAQGNSNPDQAARDHIKRMTVSTEINGRNVISQDAINGTAVNGTIDGLRQDPARYNILMRDAATNLPMSNAEVADRIRASVPMLLNGSIVLKDAQSGTVIQAEVGGQNVPVTINRQTGEIGVMRDRRSQAPDTNRTQAVWAAPGPASHPAPTGQVGPEEGITQIRSPQAMVQQLTVDAQRRNVPADPYVSRLVNSPDQQRMLSAVSNAIKDGQLPDYIVNWLRTQPEFDDLRVPARLNRVRELWSVQGNRQQLLATNEAASPMQSFVILMRDVGRISVRELQAGQAPATRATTP